MFNEIKVINRKTKMYIKTPFTTLTISRRSLDYLAKTIFNSLKNNMKSNKKFMRY